MQIDLQQRFLIHLGRAEKEKLTESIITLYQGNVLSKISKKVHQFVVINFEFICLNMLIFCYLGKFVEHGEFEKNYYGTSLGAIEAVVQSGKICVLILHVHSIPILRQGLAGKYYSTTFI